MGIRRITGVKLLCQTVCERIRVTAFLTEESEDFRQVWRRTKFRKSLSPSHCWPDWQTKVVWWAGQVGRECWAGLWLSPAWPPSGRERGSWGQPQSQLSLSHLGFVVVCSFSTVFVTSYTSSFSVSASFAGWDLVAFLKEKVDRVPVLPLV